MLMEEPTLDTVRWISYETHEPAVDGPSQESDPVGSSRHTVWGTPVISDEPLRSEDPSGWLPDWERELLLEEEILAQIEQEESGGRGGGLAPSHGKGQKKKKFKKVTLMTNGGKRGA